MVQLSKAGTKDNPTLKAGHPPAVKAGGMRVAKKSSEDNVAVERKPKGPISPGLFQPLPECSLSVSCWQGLLKSWDMTFQKRR
uniref:Uncharacterized protein n=1 Tax=Anguilla anguilla TaxID=7936 RepID=A0A0E9SL74_ANGAN